MEWRKSKRERMCPGVKRYGGIYSGEGEERTEAKRGNGVCECIEGSDMDQSLGSKKLS